MTTTPRALAAIAAAIGLAACTTKPIPVAAPLPARAPAASAATAPAGPAKPAPRPPRPPASKPTPAQPAAPQVAAPLVPPPPAAIVPPDLKLIGLNQSATRALLGAPAAERDGRPGKVWRYRADTCSFDVHFFFDVAKNDFYALQVVPQAPDRSAAAAQRCAESLWIARQQQAAG